MEKLRLGRTGLSVSRVGFGVLPIQRVDIETAKTILVKAVENGINFFDTARAYTDSEEKIGYALSGVREKIIIATKTHAQSGQEAAESIETSLKLLKTGYVDLLQLHNPKELPDPEDPDSTYSALVRAKEQGKIRFIGITSHILDVATAAAESGLYDTVQFPLSAISSPEDLQLIEVCRRHDVGVIAMKALCGGILTNIRAAFAFLAQYDNVVPIWGIQRESELDEFLNLSAVPPELDTRMQEEITRDREELSESFCRGCGYCLPCPAEIPIPMAARMKFLLRRAPTENFLTNEWQGNMRRIEDCTECNHCRENCPYGLDTPALLREMYQDYQSWT